MTVTLPFAIVTDALWRKSVSAIRSLGRGGYPVIALGDSKVTTGFHSRFTTLSLVGPTASTSKFEFGALLERAIMHAAPLGRPVILPMEDESCSWLLEHGEQLAECADWLLPSAHAFGIANNKADTMRLADKLGVPCPITFFPENPKGLLEYAYSHSQIRWLAKPLTAKGAAGILYEDDLTVEAVTATWAKYGPLLLQERIPAEGAAFGINVLYDRSACLRAVFCHRRLRQYPASGGPSTSRISVAPEALPEIVDHSCRLLESLGWQGVAMLEWKQDPATGRHLLLEINPRFWGSLDLAIRAGVDFPVLYARLAQGLFFPEQLPQYRDGVICRWMIPGEILRYLTEPRKARETLWEFFQGSLNHAEEYARDDLRGSVACVLCPALLALHPRYWQYFLRGSGMGKGSNGFRLTN